MPKFLVLKPKYFKLREVDENGDPYFAARFNVVDEVEAADETAAVQVAKQKGHRIPIISEEVK